MNEGLNVRETEAIRQQQNQGPLRHSAKQNFSEKQQINKDPSDQNEAVQLAQKLQEHLGIKTKITTYDTGGTLSFYFTSFEQLDELMQKLGT
jgi:ParB-like chromosome segregation protein Spo0J